MYCIYTWEHRLPGVGPHLLYRWEIRKYPSCRNRACQLVFIVFGLLLSHCRVLSPTIVVPRCVIDVLSTNILSLSCDSCWLRDVVVLHLQKMKDCDTVHCATFVQWSSCSGYCCTTIWQLSCDYLAAVVCRGNRQVSCKNCKSCSFVRHSSVIVPCGTQP